MKVKIEVQVNQQNFVYLTHREGEDFFESGGSTLAATGTDEHVNVFDIRTGAQQFTQEDFPHESAASSHKHGSPTEELWDG